MSNEKEANEYVKRAIGELISGLGVKENADSRELRKMLHVKETKKCIKAIAIQLGLPIEIDLSFVSKDYRPDDNNRFHSHGLARTDSRGQGIEGITAQVLIPNNLASYGTSGLKNLTIRVKVSENCYEHPQTFISVIAHELSHVLLYSIWHPQKNNELYTDLAAMILGFTEVFEKGRKVTKVKSIGNTTETQTTTYGYLNDEQFDFACKKILSALEERRRDKERLLEKINELKQEYCDTERSLLRFNRFLNYIDNKHSRTINANDSFKIVSFHQPGYTCEFEKAIGEGEKLLTEARNYCEGLVHYGEHTMNLIQEYIKRTEVLNNGLKGKRTFLDDNVKTIAKYISLWYRIKENLGLNSKYDVKVKGDKYGFPM